MSTSEPTTLSATDLALLLNELRDVTDPHKLGLMLGIRPATVTILLENKGNDIERQKSNVLEHWLNNDEDASWTTLAKALREIDLVRLAERLEKTYTIKREVEGLKQDPEDDDIQGKKAEIWQSEKAAKIEYGRFLYYAGKLMEEKQVYLPDVKLTWSGYDSKMSTDACQAKDMQSFLIALRGNQGPYAYENIGALLILFCDKDGEALVAGYEKKLKNKLRPRVMPIKRKGKRFSVKIDIELGQGSKSLDFRNTLAKLFECRAIDFLLEDVHDGCIELIYIVPSELAESLQKYCNLLVKQRKFKEERILELRLQSHLLWSSVLTQKKVMQRLSIDIDDPDASTVKLSHTLFDISMHSRSRYPIAGKLRSRYGMLLVLLGCILTLSGPFMWLIHMAGAVPQISQTTHTQVGMEASTPAKYFVSVGLVLCIIGLLLHLGVKTKKCLLFFVLGLVLYIFFHIYIDF